MDRERRRQHDPPFLVGFRPASIAEQGQDKIFVFRTELIVAFERCAERLKPLFRPALDARVLMRWTQHQRGDRGGLAGVAHLLKHGTKLRGNRHTPLGVQLVLVGADKLGHPDPPAFRAWVCRGQIRRGSDASCGTARRTASSRLPLWMMVHRGQPWDSMGGLGRQRNWLLFRKNCSKISRSRQDTYPRHARFISRNSISRKYSYFVPVDNLVVNSRARPALALIRAVGQGG